MDMFMNNVLPYCIYVLNFVRACCTGTLFFCLWMRFIVVLQLLSLSWNLLSYLLLSAKDRSKVSCKVRCNYSKQGRSVFLWGRGVEYVKDPDFIQIKQIFPSWELMLGMLFLGSASVMGISFRLFKYLNKNEVKKSVVVANIL